MALDVDSLRDPLRRLADRIISEVEILRAAGRLPLHSVRYTLRPDFSLRYSDLTFMNVPLESGEEDEWPWSDLEKFVTQQIRPTEEYVRIQGLVQGAELLMKFSWRVAHEAAIWSSQTVDAHIATLIRDITNAPQQYHMKLWLNGITVAQDEIRVSDSLTLRRPRETDFQEKVREEMSHYAHP